MEDGRTLELGILREQWVHRAESIDDNTWCTHQAGVVSSMYRTAIAAAQGQDGKEGSKRTASRGGQGW